MIVNNVEKIKEHIFSFLCKEDEFYMLQIIHRAKDGNTKYEDPGKKSHEQVIRTYFISSPEYLDKKMPEIIDLCKQFNARALINLNKKSWKQVGLKSLELTAQALAKEGKENKWWKSIKSTVESACGQTGAVDGKKTWVIDIDSKDPEVFNKFVEIIHQCEPTHIQKIELTVPTVHGYHLITQPFNKSRFKELFQLAFPGIKDDPIKDNNPTILYAETPEWETITK